MDTTPVLAGVGLAIAVFTLTAAHSQTSGFERFTTSRGISEQDFQNLLRQQQSRSAAGTPPQSKQMSRVEVRTGRIDPRIVGGEPTTFDDNPWQVALIFGSKIGPEPVRQQFCGGTVMAADWVVTAAHCVDGSTTPDRVDIIAGTATYRHFGERIPTASIFVHPGWNPGTQENDIALLKLAKPAKLGKPVALAAKDLVLPDGTKTTVSGWGAILEGSQGSDILMWVDVPTVSRDECNRPESYNGQIKAGMLCAGVRAGGLDSCQGDSGGPLFSRISAVPTLVGVVSWGEGCARSLKYGVYTQVSSFRDWVDTTVAANK